MSDDVRPPKRFNAACTTFVDGDYHVKTECGEWLIISHGIAQVLQARQGIDEFLASQEARREKKTAKKA